MDQTEARAEAKRLNEEQPLAGVAWVAMTNAAMRGQFEPPERSGGTDWTVTVVPIQVGAAWKREHPSSSRRVTWG